MRAFFILSAALAVCIGLCICLMISNHHLRESVAQLQAQVALAEGVREADADAIRTSNEGRQNAARTAQEGRDALQEIEKRCADMPDSDFLCRLRGVFGQAGNNGADAAGKPAGGMPRTDAAQRHEGGE